MVKSNTVYVFISAVILMQLTDFCESISKDDPNACSIITHGWHPGRHHYHSPRRQRVMRTLYVCCRGYFYNDTSELCEPICGEGCRYGTCVGPNICKCNHVYQLDPEGKFNCLPPSVDSTYPTSTTTSTTERSIERHLNVNSSLPKNAVIGTSYVSSTETVTETPTTPSTKPKDVNESIKNIIKEYQELDCKRFDKTMPEETTKESDNWQRETTIKLCKIIKEQIMPFERHPAAVTDMPTSFTETTNSSTIVPTTYLTVSPPATESTTSSTTASPNYPNEMPASTIATESTNATPNDPTEIIASATTTKSTTASLNYPNVTPSIATATESTKTIPNYPTVIPTVVPATKPTTLSTTIPPNFAFVTAASAPATELTTSSTASPTYSTVPAISSLPLPYKEILALTLNSTSPPSPPNSPSPLPQTL